MRAEVEKNQSKQGVKGVERVQLCLCGLSSWIPATSLWPGCLWALIRLTFHFYTSTAADESESTFHWAYGRYHMAYG